MKMSALCSLAVVVPVHDEETSVAACLDSIQESASALRIPTRVVVVLDRCRDASAAVVRSHRTVTAVRIEAGNVGRARRLGIDRVLADLPHRPLGRIWLATTDADSVVTPDWLERQVDWADRGADALVGLIELADDGLRPLARRDFNARYHSWASGPPTHTGHPHVHGANLGFRASAYADVGGFVAATSHEDRNLVVRLDRARQVQVRRTSEAPVVTSSRIAGRAPAGVAADLARLDRS